MKQTLFSILLILSISCISQIQVKTNNNLIISHGDITLYLTDDTCTMVSKHVVSYESFKNVGKVPRDNHWFQDVYKGKYKKNAYVHTGYDLGHLTPSSITSYDSITNHNSFSLFNQAPQIAHFNEHPWEQLEMHVMDTISKYKKDAIIITGVIYDYTKKPEYLSKSRIRIPVSYYKILTITDRTYVWIGSNINEQIVPITVEDLNKIFELNKMNLIIK